MEAALVIMNRERRLLPIPFGHLHIEKYDIVRVLAETAKCR
mgnify:CR=1 FL=1